MNQSPYKDFGTKLKHLRESAKETLFDVSGAVEIEVDRLERIEKGVERPSEDIVLLLINHFELKEPEADSFWVLAGYSPDFGDEPSYGPDDSSHMNAHKIMQPAIMIMPMDARIVYTDMVQVTVNDFGVIMNFMQGTGPKMQPLAVSRIGMSKEHAYSVLKVLQDTLSMYDKPKVPKTLQPPSDTKTK